MNILSYMVFKGFVRPTKSFSNRLLRVGMGIAATWAALRIMNYIFQVSLVGRYTDDILVILLVFCLDYLFISKLTDANKLVRCVQYIRFWYTIFNGSRLILFLLGLFIYPTHIIAYPLSNIDKKEDYPLIGPYWGNKQKLIQAWTLFDGQDDIVGRQDILSIIEKGILFKRVVFQRKYETSYRYFAASDPSRQIVQIGQDSIMDEDACFYVYRRNEKYYLTYLGDGESCVGDVYTVWDPNGQVASRRLINKDYLDSSNKAAGLPVGVQDYPLN